MRLTLNAEAVRLNILHRFYVTKRLFNHLHRLIAQLNDRKESLIMAAQQELSVHTKPQVGEDVAHDRHNDVHLPLIIVVIRLHSGLHLSHRHHKAHIDQLIREMKGRNSTAIRLNGLNRVGQCALVALHLIDLHG